MKKFGKFVMTVLFYIAVINAARFLGSTISGNAFEFDLVLSVAIPVICAVIGFQAKEKKLQRQN